MLRSLGLNFSIWISIKRYISSIHYIYTLMTDCAIMAKIKPALSITLNNFFFKAIVD